MAKDPYEWRRGIEAKKSDLQQTILARQKANAAVMKGRRTATAAARMRALTTLEDDTKGEYGDDEDDWQLYLSAVAFLFC